MDGGRCVQVSADGARLESADDAAERGPASPVAANSARGAGPEGGDERNSAHALGGANMTR
ncbi:MAG: hypothetical protein HS123_15965 [Solibacteraceae bacterium]|nr:hypothetical protein [Solibacteraceae bacterium]